MHSWPIFIPGRARGGRNLPVPTASAVPAASAEAATTKAAATETAEAVAAAKVTEAGGASTEATRVLATLVTAAEPAKATVGAVIGRPLHRRRPDFRALRESRWSLGTGHGRCLRTRHERSPRCISARHVPWRLGGVRGRNLHRSVGCR